MPRDIVGGDFIFAHRSDRGALIAIIDCTGHGVPGAFMTIVASFALRKIVKDEGHRDPARILKCLNAIVRTSLRQDTEHALSDDGLDAAVCFVPLSENRGGAGQSFADGDPLTFAGAKLPLIHVRNGKADIVKGDRRSIGYKKSDPNFDFTRHRIPMEKGMCFYLTTDGFVDQLGGERGRRFGMGRFRKLLCEHAALSFEKQREMLIEAFEDWKERGRESERQDDVTVPGFSIG